MSDPFTQFLQTLYIGKLTYFISSANFYIARGAVYKLPVLIDQTQRVAVVNTFFCQREEISATLVRVVCLGKQMAKSGNPYRWRLANTQCDITVVNGFFYPFQDIIPGYEIVVIPPSG